MSQPPIRVALVDDHAFIRRGLRETLSEADDIVVVSETCDGPSALEAVRRLAAAGEPVHVLVTDVTMPGFDGFELLSRVHAEYPDLAAVMLSVHPEAELALAALQAGAQGYVEKGAAADRIVEAVRRVASGRRYVSDAFGERLAAAAAGPAAEVASLSTREMQALRGVAEGLTRAQIASALGVAEATVATYLVRVRKKLGLATDAQIARYAFAHGIAEAPRAIYGG